MPDQITDLLDQIDRLDQQATKGPWDHTVEWAEICSGSDSVIHGYGYAHCDGCDEEIEGVDARVALSPHDAEFISLARDVLPKLAKVIDELINHCHEVMSWETPRGHEERIALESRRQGARAVYKAITDAMELRNA